MAVTEISEYRSIPPPALVPSGGRVVLCGSMSTRSVMEQVVEDLDAIGVPSVLPDRDDSLHRSKSWDEAVKIKRAASIRHLRRVTAPSTCAVLVVNTNKHGIMDYIGPNTLGEIVVAFTRGHAVFLYQRIPHDLRDELEAWGVVPLAGDLSPLVAAYRKRADQPQQLTLFP